MFSFFSSRRRSPAQLLPTDLHSHLLPSIDDGVRTIDESIQVIDLLMEAGYSQIITTPHIMTDYFRNTFESIRAAYDEFLPALRARGYSIPFHAAAEYYFDEEVFQLAKNDAPLLTFGDKYLLFETNVISEPLQLKEFIFALTSKGYRPVLAHPERYQYMNLQKAEDLRDRGVLLQVNMLSLIGVYGPPIQQLATKLIDQGWIDALGSDCHNAMHAGLLKKVQKTKLYDKALSLPLINHKL